MGWPSHELYRRYVGDTWVQPDGYDHADGHWARDAERALRDHGMAVSGDRARPGDLLFNWRAAWSARWGAYIGHTGVQVDHGLDSRERRSRTTALTAPTWASSSLTPRKRWAEPTTIIRFDPSKVGA